MSQSSPTTTSLTRLALFMVCLSIAGSLAAGLHYAAIDLPGKVVVTAPQNGSDPDCDRANMDRCMNSCITKNGYMNVACYLRCMSNVCPPL